MNGRNVVSDKKCAGAEGEELVLSWQPSKREPVQCLCWNSSVMLLCVVNLAELIKRNACDWLGESVPHSSSPDFSRVFSRHLASRHLYRNILLLYYYYPGQKKKKKEPSLRFAARRTLFHHVISCSIKRDQRTARVADDLALRWSLVIRHDITRSNSVLLAGNLGDGSFFFFCPG